MKFSKKEVTDTMNHLLEKKRCEDFEAVFKVLKTKYRPDRLEITADDDSVALDIFDNIIFKAEPTIKNGQVHVPQITFTFSRKEGQLINIECWDHWTEIDDLPEFSRII